MPPPSDKKHRQLEATVTALQAAGGELKIVVVNKVLFYADLLALRDGLGPLTRSTYLAVKNGPVVARYDKSLVKPLVSQGLAVQKSVGSAKPLCLTEHGREFDAEVLSLEELAVVQESVKHFANMNSGEASHWSHDNPGGLAAANSGFRRPEGKPLPINLLLALQDERLYDDEDAAEEGLDEELRRGFEDVAAGRYEDWS